MIEEPKEKELLTRAEKHKKANAEAKDWRAMCRVCHKPLEGTLAELMAHKCEVHDVHTE